MHFALADGEYSAEGPPQAPMVQYTARDPPRNEFSRTIG
jgi:hypothetical protein